KRVGQPAPASIVPASNPASKPASKPASNPASNPASTPESGLPPSTPASTPPSSLITVTVTARVAFSYAFGTAVSEKVTVVAYVPASSATEVRWMCTSVGTAEMGVRFGTGTTCTRVLVTLMLGVPWSATVASTKLELFTVFTGIVTASVVGEMRIDGSTT